MSVHFLLGFGSNDPWRLRALILTGSYYLSEFGDFRIVPCDPEAFDRAARINEAVEALPAGSVAVLLDGDSIPCAGEQVEGMVRLALEAPGLVFGFNIY